MPLHTAGETPVPPSTGAPSAASGNPGEHSCVQLYTGESQVLVFLGGRIIKPGFWAPE
jgi:hypothetical protein